MAPSRQSSPTTLLSLAICCHLIAYVIVCVAAFTPEWSSITENNGIVDVTYDKGVITSCGVPTGPSECSFTRGISEASTEFFICFLLVIASIVLGFFTLQMLCCGACVKSIKRRNMGIPLLAMFILLAVLLLGCLGFFELSITQDVTPGNKFVDSTVGLSRILLGVAIGLYIICSFFALGEHMKRKSGTSVGQDDDAYSVDSLPKTPNNDDDDKSNTSQQDIKKSEPEPEKEKSIISDKNNNEQKIVEEKTEKVTAAPTTTTNKRDSFRNERKFSRKENKKPAPFSDAGYNPTRRANTSIVPLEGYALF